MIRQQQCWICSNFVSWDKQNNIQRVCFTKNTPWGSRVLMLDDGGLVGRCVSLRCGLCTKHTHTKLLLLQIICVWGSLGFFFSPQENWTKEDHDWRFSACLELKRHPFSTFTEIPKAAVTKMTPRQWLCAVNDRKAGSAENCVCVCVCVSSVIKTHADGGP